MFVCCFKELTKELESKTSESDDKQVCVRVLVLMAKSFLCSLYAHVLHLF